MAKYLVRAAQFRPLMDGDSTPLGDIEISQPGNEWTLIDVDDEQKLIDAQANGQIMEFKPESVLSIPSNDEIHPKVEPELWGRGTVVRPHTLENRMGVDYPIWGITEEWQSYVDNEDIIVGVADTGKPTQAAMEAHAPDVELIHILGGEDHHGHQTACTLRIVGTRGVIPKARKVVTAQALAQSNGTGTTSDIVNAIRALKNWRGENGERVSVISLSLGMDGRDGVIDREIIDTQNQGVVCSAAMGNSGWNIRTTGTPAAVCLFAWGATTFSGNQPASFSTGGSNLPEETAAGPGENVGLAHLDGGYGTGSGTSFSNPTGAGIVAALLKYGMTVTQIKEYIRTHQIPFNPPRRVGLLRLNAEDFKNTEPTMPPDTKKYFDEIIWRAQELDARIAQAQNFREALQNGTMSWNDLFNSSLGPGRDLLREMVELANSGKVSSGGVIVDPPPPPDTNPPTNYPDVRTYMKGWSARAHWPGSVEGEYAIDWYPAPLGTEFGWIVGGRTRGTGQMGPLFIPMDGHDCISVPTEGEVVAHTIPLANNGGPEVIVKACRFADDDWRVLPAGHVFIPEGYTLYTLILDSDDGSTMFAFTHVLKNALLNVHVEPHQPFVQVGDSGLEMFTANNQNAAHVHLAIMQSREQYGQWMGGKGNIKPWQWMKDNGFQIREVARVPSPNDYMAGYVNREPY